MEIINPPNNDEYLWKKAKKRVSFKSNATAYVLVNLFLTGIWFFSSNGIENFWPAWPMMGWGVGLAFHYYDAYVNDARNSLEKEFRKLKEEQR